MLDINAPLPHNCLLKAPTPRLLCVTQFRQSKTYICRPPMKFWWGNLYCTLVAGVRCLTAREENTIECFVTMWEVWSKRWNACLLLHILGKHFHSLRWIFQSECWSASSSNFGCIKKDLVYKSYIFNTMSFLWKPRPLYSVSTLRFRKAFFCAWPLLAWNFDRFPTDWFSRLSTNKCHILWQSDS